MLDAFREVWCVDFEFGAPPGERPDVRCLVARNLKTGQTLRLMRDELGRRPPYPTGPDCLFVAYYASAELGCHMALKWPMPERVLDLFTEFRVQTNGLPTALGNNGLLCALTQYGLDSIGADEKQAGRELAMRGPPYTEAEKVELLDYCESDVDALARLLPAMLPKIDLPRALLRGRYMAAAARMEHRGVPIDMETLNLFRAHWDDIKGALIGRIDAGYNVFVGYEINRAKFDAWLTRKSMPWPRLESGALDLDKKTFRDMAKSYPIVAPLHELKHSLSGLKLNDLEVGPDGRNRRILSAFGTKTGRNSPSSAKFIFGPAVWIRGLIKPPPGYGISYIDWKQQEFGIAAALSKDTNMIAAYLSGDPYFAFAQMAGAIPRDADPKDTTWRPVRNLFKQCVLAVQYGGGPHLIAGRIAQPLVVARDLLQAHQETFRTFWKWSDGAVDYAMIRGHIHTALGWTQHIGPESNPRSLQNFPMQANGGELMRLAACLATERGIEVCAPVHDAFLIMAPLERLADDTARMQACMAEASRVVLSGFELGSDAEPTHYPGRFRDKDGRGDRMWAEVTALISKIIGGK
jgi:DNA polymerase I